MLPSVFPTFDAPASAVRSLPSPDRPILSLTSMSVSGIASILQSASKPTAVVPPSSRTKLKMSMPILPKPVPAALGTLSLKVDNININVFLIRQQPILMWRYEHEDQRRVCLQQMWREFQKPHNTRDASTVQTLLWKFLDTSPSLVIFYGTFAKFTEQILCPFRNCYIFMDCIKNFNFKFYIVLSMSISDFEINKLLGCFH